MKNKINRIFRNNNFFILILLFVTVFLRFYKLGEVPDGLGIDEVRFGNKLSDITGPWIKDEMLLRFPFALFGTFSVFLFYKLLQKLYRSFWIAFIAALFMSISPWHIQESRIYSIGIVVLTVVLVIAYFSSGFLGKRKKILGKLMIFISMPILLLSVLQVPPGIKTIVDTQRNIAVKSGIVRSTALFSNKYIESYRYREKLLFENLDIGNYFFSGHPRERVGVEEMQKLYFAAIIPLLIGVVYLKRDLIWLLAGFSLLTISVGVLLGERNNSLEILLLIVFSLLFAKGIIGLRLQKRYAIPLVGLVFFFIVFEALTFINYYFNSYSESAFNPRRPSYRQLSNEIQDQKREGESVLINTRIEGIEDFVIFYSNNDLKDFIFRNYDIWQEENLDRLFVDILPFDPSPSEPLYLDENKSYETIKIVVAIEDEIQKQHYLIYRTND